MPLPDPVAIAGAIGAGLAGFFTARHRTQRADHAAVSTTADIVTRIESTLNRHVDDTKENFRDVQASVSALGAKAAANSERIARIEARQGVAS